MPLPLDPRQAWPPESEALWIDQYREHSAWYSSNPQKLADFYSSAAYTPTPTGHIWARETRERITTAVHMPLAADLAKVSADLLFAEPPDFLIPEAQGDTVSQDWKDSQDVFNNMIDQAGVVNRLLEGAETCAAMGGVYLRPVWDKKVAPHPILDIVQPDAAVPEFAWGYMTAVTFWRVVMEDDKAIYRHLERHEVNAEGNGIILHGLYKGDSEKLGVPLSLKALPATAGLEPVIDTKMPGLCAYYIPNMRPNRLDRASPLGASDYYGVEGLFQSLDETWTSLITELQLCKVRVFVPEEFIERDRDGATFNEDQQIYVALNIDPLTAQGNNHLFEIQQPELRVEDHLRLASELVTNTVTRVGYAPQTFGLEVDGNAPSGTSLRIRERRSLTSLGKKQGYWKPAVAGALWKMHYLNVSVFGAKAEIPEHPAITVAWADSVAPDIAELAQTVNLLKQAESASIEARVRMLHPDWGDKAITEEVSRIKDDAQAALGGLAGDPTGGALDTLDAPTGDRGGDSGASGNGTDQESAKNAQNGSGARKAA